MNRSIQVIGIIGATLLLSLGIGQNSLAQYNLSNTPIWVKINYVAKETTKDGPSMYLELEIKNLSNKSIVLTSVQQGSLNGPDDIFLVKNSKGENVRTRFEMREHFGQNGRELKSGEILYRYYKSLIHPTLMDKNLHFNFGVSTIGHGSFVTESLWAVPRKMEEKPFLPKK
ncbi:hypothetical protein [Algoriphagus pacificus]|uniref:Gliding motility-associated lipoprotein GldH n=1 Tax=Algoriphagus pacificus TaxID=2811234 RepID=A0ABS3CIJ5_9BACT|nr:hypothetical protein [Algoriphagus pacificus]MBN7816923.1 hypothetical protein [Algoriphagus pacificus]